MPQPFWSHAATELAGYVAELEHHAISTVSTLGVFAQGEWGVMVLLCHWNDHQSFHSECGLSFRGCAPFTHLIGRAHSPFPRVCWCCITRACATPGHAHPTAPSQSSITYRRVCSTKHKLWTHSEDLRTSIWKARSTVAHGRTVLSCACFPVWI